MVKEGALLNQNADSASTQKIISTSYCLLGIIYLLEWLVFAVISVFSNWFEPFQSGGLFMPILLSFGGLATVYFLSSVFLIWNKAHIQAIAISCISIGGLLGVIFGYLLKFGIQGFLLSFLIGQTISGVFVLFYLSRLEKDFWPIPSWNTKIAKQLGTFTIAFSITVLINQLSAYGLVRWALETMGSEKVGLWMAMNRISDVYNVPILAVANSILLPLLSSHGQNLPELKKVLSPIFKQSVFLIALGLLILYFIYPFLLPLLFSKAFVPEKSWITWQLAGDFFKSSSFVIVVIVLSMGHTKTYFWLELVSVSLMLFLTVFLFGKFGMQGVFMAHFSRFLVYWGFIVFKYRKVLV